MELLDHHTAVVRSGQFFEVPISERLPRGKHNGGDSNFTPARMGAGKNCHL